MTLFKTMTWSPLNIVLLKWSCVLVGALWGAWLSVFIKRYAGRMLILAVLLGLKPAIDYWRRPATQA